VADVVHLSTGHPLVGTWRDSDADWGTTVQFTIKPVAARFEVRGVDTADGEQLAISNVEWDGRILNFISVVPSRNRRIECTFELVSPSEVTVRYTATDRWVKVDDAGIRNTAT
jgi:hypothetical protein